MVRHGKFTDAANNKRKNMRKGLKERGRAHLQAHTCTTACCTGVESVLGGDRERRVAAISRPIPPPKKRPRKKLMSLLKPHSSPDKAADYATCSEKDDCLCMSTCTLLSVCHLTQNGQPLIRRRRSHTFSDDCTFTPIGTQ